MNSGKRSELELIQESLAYWWHLRLWELMRLFRESENENRRAPKGKANNINTLGTQREVGEKPGECMMWAKGGEWRIWDSKPFLSDSKAYAPMHSFIKYLSFAQGVKLCQSLQWLGKYEGRSPQMWSKTWKFSFRRISLEGDDSDNWDD